MNNDSRKKIGQFNWFDYSVDYAVISDKGQVRKVNEDSFIVLENEGYFGIADGAGGHENGARASMLTVTGIEKYLKKSTDPVDDTVPLDTSDDFRFGDTAISYVNNIVFRESSGRHMASTIVACQLFREKLLVEHVGDSRCYLYRNKNLSLLTEDHSVVNDLYRDGKISLEEIKTHKYRNVITRAIGVAENVEVESKWVGYQNEDLFLLCSDGLSSFVDDETMAHFLAANQSVKSIADNLVNLANKAGGRDNITVMILKIEEKNWKNRPYQEDDSTLKMC